MNQQFVKTLQETLSARARKVWLVIRFVEVVVSLANVSLILIAQTRLSAKILNAETLANHQTLVE